ncbi:MAG: histidinol-phosphatase [Victivallales bacterium]|nr:histidinol-phosphatase [Victivallales bacterium]
MENRQVNLHCHTFLCRHATGTVRDYCEKAIEQGLKILGFSEHAPFPDNRYGSRMDYDQLPEYRQAIEEARHDFPELTILAGLEVDYDPEFPLDFYQHELKERLKLDYLVGAVHFVHDAEGKPIFVGVNSHHSMETFRRFVDKTVFLIQSGMFDFIAHPDMVSSSLDRWTPEIGEQFSEIIKTAAACSVPLELNCYGMRKREVEYTDGTRHPYPWLPFWKMASEYGIPCVVGSDAHRPEDVSGNLPEMLDKAQKLGVPCINNNVAQSIITRQTNNLK